MAEGQTAYIGDGASDVKVAPLVDLLFARRGFYLAHYCQTEGIPFVPFSSFRDVQEHLLASLAGPTN
jgi:2-hydroxy-3-keto-5-methylthiopentenyl-1-phosphate phosphatase